MRSKSVVSEQGFHALETQNGLPFRWMTRAGRLRFPACGTTAFVELQIRAHFPSLTQTLKASIADGSRTFELIQGWNIVSIEVPAGSDTLDLETDRTLPQQLHPGDGRVLALQLRAPVLHTDGDRHRHAARRHYARIESLRTLRAQATAEEERGLPAARFEEGFHQIEDDCGSEYRWTARHARLTFPPVREACFFEISVFSPFQDLSQHVSLSADGQAPSNYILASLWNTLPLPIPAGAGAVLVEATRLLPAAFHPADDRELSVKARMPQLHSDAFRHAHIARQHANHVRNHEELLAKAVELTSTPPKLGIDMIGRCNVKPPCVFCAWDWNKSLEGKNVDAPFDLGLLEQWGDSFENASELVNCSIGEPFMTRDIDALLEAFGRRGQVVELTTNGQILTDANIRKLLGCHVHLYVSIDAATAVTYARLRNDRFESVVDNVRRLVDAKGGPGRLPLVYLVFMPMRANLHEVDDFVTLCADLQVDRLVLRPLNASEGADLKADRCGYHFDYQRELLPFDELVRVSGRIAHWCRVLGVPLSDQMSFGGDLRRRFAAAFDAGGRDAIAALEAIARAQADGDPQSDVVASCAGFPEQTWEMEAVPSMSVPAPIETPAPTSSPPPSLGQEALPLCLEPWTSLYILRRGVFPCCYGGAPIAPMREFRQAWNSPLLKAIRAALAAGRFHRYCFDSPDCPIVRQAEHHRDLPLSQRAELFGQRALLRIKRSGYGWPGQAYRTTKRLVLTARARVRGFAKRLIHRGRT